MMTVRGEVYSRKSMHRAAALIVLVALTAGSARQLACVWECAEPAGTPQAASCHETAAHGPSLAAADVHCPLTPDAAVLTTGAAGEPQRPRLSLALDRPAAAPDVGAMLHTFDIRPTWSPRHVHGHRSRTLPVLRI
jgi:hypothetical protein